MFQIEVFIDVTVIIESVDVSLLCHVKRTCLTDVSSVHVESTVVPRLTKIIRSGITFVSRNVISRRFL
jgi:hypothetical protein